MLKPRVGVVGTDMEWGPMGELMTEKGGPMPLMGELRVLMGECSCPGEPMPGPRDGCSEGAAMEPRPVGEVREEFTWVEKSARQEAAGEWSVQVTPGLTRHLPPQLQTHPQEDPGTLRRPRWSPQLTDANSHSLGARRAQSSPPRHCSAPDPGFRLGLRQTQEEPTVSEPQDACLGRSNPQHSSPLHLGKQREEGLVGGTGQSAPPPISTGTQGEGLGRIMTGIKAGVSENLPCTRTWSVLSVGEFVDLGGPQ